MMDAELLELEKKFILSEAEMLSYLFEKAMYHHKKALHFQAEYARYKTHLGGREAEGKKE